MTPTCVEEVLAVFANNQRRYFDQVVHEAEILKAMEAQYGPDYVEKICDAIKTAGRKSILFETVGVQPFNAPVIVLYYKGRPWETSSQEAPGLRSLEISAETRKIRASFDLSSTVLDTFIRGTFREERTNHALETCFDSAWGEIEQEVFSTIHDAGGSTHPFKLVIRHQTAGEDIQRLVCSTDDHERMGPIDAVLMSTDALEGLKQSLTGRLELVPPNQNPNGRPVKAGVLYSRINIYVDPQYPKRRVMAFRRAQDRHDRTLVWSPYLFSGSGFTDQDNSRMHLRVRHKITLLDKDITAHGEFI